MSKAYLQPFLIFPDAVLGSMLVTLAGETDATPVYDPNTGSILSQPLEINSVGEVTPFHANDNVLYDLHVFAAGISAVVGNQLYTRENVTVVGGSNGLPGTNGKSVRVQAVTGGAQVYDEFGNTVIVLDGEDGEDGTTPVKGVDYFDGINGTTPVKGVDYVDGADGIAGYIQLPALPVDPSTVPIGQPVILPDGTMWTNVTGSWTALAVSEAMLTAGLAELVPVDAVTDGSTKAVTSNAVFDALANKASSNLLPVGAGSAHYIKTLGSSTTGWFFAGRVEFYKGAYSNEVGVAVIRFARSTAVGHEIDLYDRVRVSYSAIAGIVNYTVVGLDGALNLLRYSGYASGDQFFIDFTIYCQPATVAIGQLESYFVSAGSFSWVNTNTDITASAGANPVFSLAPTPPAGDNSTKVATTEFVGKPSGSVITLSSSQTITPTNGAVYYVSGSYDITLSNSSALGTRCYIQADGNCPQNSKILFTDVAGNSNGVGFGYGDSGAGGVMCERFASGWMVVGGVAP